MPMVSDFMTTGPRTIFFLHLFYLFLHVCLHFSLNNVDGSHSAGLWCYYSRPLLTQLGGTGDQRCICIYLYIYILHSHITYYIYIYIFIYWGAPRIKSFSSGKGIYSLNYCQGIAIIVALELSFDSAFFKQYKRRGVTGGFRFRIARISLGWVLKRSIKRYRCRWGYEVQNVCSIVSPRVFKS